MLTAFKPGASEEQCFAILCVEQRVGAGAIAEDIDDIAAGHLLIYGILGYPGKIGRRIDKAEWPAIESWAIRGREELAFCLVEAQVFGIVKILAIGDEIRKMEVGVFLLCTVGDRVQLCKQGARGVTCDDDMLHCREESAVGKACD